jgi:hypothetical protein
VPVKLRGLEGRDKPLYLGKGHEKIREVKALI